MTMYGILQKKLTFCDCNYEFATIITLLLQFYVSSDYGAYVTSFYEFTKR